MRPDHGVEVQNINKRVFSGILIIPAPLARLLESERFVQADGGRIADPHFKHCSQYARFFGFPQGCGHEEASEAAAPSVRAHRDIEDFHFIRRMVHGYVPRKAFFAGRFADAEGVEGVPGEGVGKGQRRPRKIETSAFQPGERGGVVNRKPDAAGVFFRMVMHHTVSESLEGEGPLIEYVDEADRPLLLAAAAEGIPLRKKMAGVVLRDAEGRVLARREAEEGASGAWRLSALTPVRSGEAREEAAERALAELDVPAEGLTELATFRPEAGRVSLTLFEASMPEGARETLNGTLLDRDELCGLAAGFPELFTEEWLWIVRSGCLWETRPRLSRR